FVAGKRLAEVAADGRRYSRALQNASVHIYEITCGADVVPGTFRTADWPLGLTYNDPIPTDPANPGVAAWPEMSWSNRFERVVDPHTGALIRRVTFPKYAKINATGYEPAEALYASGSNWTNPANALTDDATSATYSGSTQDAVVLRTEYYIPRTLAHVDGLQVELKGCVADGATGADRDIEVAFSVTGTATPYGKWLPVTLQNETGCTASAQQVGDASNPVPVMSAWLNPAQQPPAISQINMRSGALSASGANVATYTWTGGLPFGSNWVPGSPVHVCDSNPCTGNYVQYTVDSVQSTSQFTATTNFDTFSSRAYKTPHLAILIRKRTASTHQVRIQYAHFRMWLTMGIVLNGGSGSTTHCSSKARADASGKLGYHCSTTNNDPADRHIWWIAPSDGEVRYRGPVWTAGPTWYNQVCTQSSMAWDTSDPQNDILYCTVNSISGKPLILKGVLNSNIVDQGELPGAGGSSVNQWAWTNITPEPNDLLTKIKAFDPSFEETIYGVSMVGLQDGKLFFSGRGGGQNTLGWNIVFDPATQSVVGAQASWKQMPARWCGIHTSFAWTGAKWMAMVPYALHGSNGPYSGPYQSTITSALSGGATQSNCQTLAPGNPLGVTGNVCSQVSVAGEPVSTSTPVGHSLGPAKVGDLFMLPISGEFVRVIAKNGNDWVVQRGFAKDYNPVGHAAGAIIRGICGAAPFLDWYYAAERENWVWWDYTNDPHATNGNDPYGLFLDNATMRYERTLGVMSHGTHRDGITISDQGSFQPSCPASPNPLSAGYGIRQAPWPNHLLYTQTYCIDGNPWFAGQSGNGHGNAVEKHVSYDQTDLTAPQQARSWYIDARPMNVYQDYAETVTPVSGQLYKVTNFFVYAVNLKKAQIAVWSADKTLLDVSAPAPFALSDGPADSFKYCKTYVAGECRAGSSVGDIYVNAPLAAPNPAGYPYFPGQHKCYAKNALSIGGGRDVCVVVMGAHADSVTQYVLRGRTDYTGVTSRRITNGLHPARGTDILWNTRPIPDGSWTLVQNNSINNTGRVEILIARVGAPPAETSINRADFVPIRRRIQTPPAGTNNVIVEYGYDAALNCMGKAEACISASGNNPYFFASE
ncbi:MAG: hypothetical protein ACRD8O_08030, partial [Bryobacteraceae bacterium]